VALNEALGSAFIEVRAKFDELKGDLQKATGEAETRLGSLSAKTQKLGSSLTRSLTPAAAAAGAVFLKAADDFNAGRNSIIQATGAAGAELESMLGVMKSVGGSVPQDLGAVGDAVGEINTRLGLTGKPLEDMTKKFLDLSRIAGGDVKTNVGLVTRVFGDWGIATEDQSAALDKLYKATQLTGVGLDRLTTLTVQYGAPLRQLGFTFEESTALFSKFEKEGVNIETVMSGIRQGLSKIARAAGASNESVLKLEKAQEEYQNTLSQFGPEATETLAAQEALNAASLEAGLGAGSASESFRKYMEEIKNAPNDTEGARIALEVFGAEAGPDMAAAIREGRFELGNMVGQLNDSEGAIGDAAARTLTLGDRMNMLKNRVMGVIGPFGEMGFAVSGMAALAGPALTIFGKLAGLFKSSGAAAAASTTPIAASGVASTAAGVGATAGAGGFAAFAASLWATLAPILLVIAVVVALIGIGILLVKNWDTITAAAKATWDFVVGVFSNGFGTIKSLYDGVLAPVLRAITGSFRAVSQAAADSVGWIMDQFGRLVGFIKDVGGAIGKVLRVMFDGLVGAFKAAWNVIARAVNSVDFKVPSFVPVIGGKTVGFPDLPMLAEGGKALTTGMAIVGERGKEAVWLPAGAEVDRRSNMQARARGGNTLIVQGNLISPRELLRWMRRQFDDISLDNPGSLF